MTVTRTDSRVYIERDDGTIIYKSGVINFSSSGSGDMTKAVYDTNDDGVVDQADVITNQGDLATKNETEIDHTKIQNIGTNTHAQIDSHISNTSNPHGVTKTQLGLSNVQNVDQTDPSNIVQDSTHRFVTDTEKSTWNAKQDAGNYFNKDTDTIDNINDGLTYVKTENNFTDAEKTKLQGIETNADVTDVENVGNSINSATEQTSLNDTDIIPFYRLALQKISWANIKTALSSIFASITHSHTKSDITDFTHTHAKSDITDFSHTHVEADITNLTHTDTNAVHTNQSGEISALTEKTTPANTDLLIIEDSADTNAKKKIQIGNLPSGSGSSTFTGLSDTPSSYTGSGLYLARVNSGETGIEFTKFGEYSTRTINLNPSMSATEIQAEIDAVGKYIDKGTTITFQFADGVYYLDQVINFAGFWGGGNIEVFGNPNDNILSATKSVELIFSNGGYLMFENNRNLMKFYYIRVVQTVGNTQLVQLSNNMAWSCYWNSYEQVSSGWGTRGCLYSMNGSFYPRVLKSYFRYGYYAVQSYAAATYVWASQVDQSAKPDYAIRADNGGIVTLSSNTLYSNIANTYAINGGQIWT